MTNLKAGRVARIRVNPTDCQSVLDIMAATKIDTRAMSFDQQVSLTLSSLLLSARSTGMIPEPDPFQFLPRMAPYMGHKSNSMKARLSAQINDLGPRLRAPVLREPERPAPSPAPAAAPVATEASADDVEMLRAASSRLTELLAKKDRAEDSGDVTWGSSDEAELQKCMKIVYPEG